MTLAVFSRLKESASRLIATDQVGRVIFLSGVVSLTLRSLGLAIGLVSHVVLSRMLGAAEYGAYSIAMSWSMILVVLATFGLDQAVLRFTPIYVQENKPSLLIGLLAHVIRILFLSSLLVFLVVLMAVWLSHSALGETRVVGAIWLSLLVCTLAYLSVFSTFLRGLREIFLSQFFEQILRPGLLVTIAGVAFFYGWQLTSETALAITTASTFVALMAASYFIYRNFYQGKQSIKPENRHREWIGMGVPILMIAIVQQSMAQLSIIVLGWVWGTENAGYYAAATRLATFVPFALVAINSIVAPMISAAYHRKDYDELARIAAHSSRISLCCALVVSIILFVLGDRILRAFGPDFDNAWYALVILLVGGIINAGTGSVGYFMTMTNNHRASLYVYATAFVVCAAAAYILIPGLGMVGAAAAASSANAMVNIAQYLLVRRRLGIDTSPFGLKPLKR